MHQFLFFYTKDGLFSMLWTTNSDQFFEYYLLKFDCSLARNRSIERAANKRCKNWSEFVANLEFVTNSSIFYLLLFQSSDFLQESNQIWVDSTRRIGRNWWFLTPKINHLWYEKRGIGAFLFLTLLRINVARRKSFITEPEFG